MIAQPTLPPSHAMQLEVIILTEQVKEYIKQTRCLDESIKRLWALVWGQCSIPSKDQDNFITTENDRNGLELPITIKVLCTTYKNKNTLHS